MPRITVTLSSDAHDALRQWAEDDDRKPSKIVERLIEAEAVRHAAQNRAVWGEKLPAYNISGSAELHSQPV